LMSMSVAQKKKHRGGLTPQDRPVRELTRSGQEQQSTAALRRTIPQVLKFLRKSAKGGLRSRVLEKLDAIGELIRFAEESGGLAIVNAGGIEVMLRVIRSTSDLAKFGGLGLEHLLLILSELTLNCEEGQSRFVKSDGVDVLFEIVDQRDFDAACLRCVVLILRNVARRDLGAETLQKACRVYGVALTDERWDSIRNTYPKDASAHVAAGHGLMRMCADFPDVVRSEAKPVLEALVGHLDLPDCRAYVPKYSNLGDVITKDARRRQRMPEMSYAMMCLFKFVEVVADARTLALFGEIAVPSLARMLGDLASTTTRAKVVDYGLFDLPGQLLELLFQAVTFSTSEQPPPEEEEETHPSKVIRGRLDDEFRATKLLKRVEDDFVESAPHVHVLAKHLRAEIRNERRCANCHVLGDDKLRKCSRCLTRFYCSAACQHAHYPDHRAECKALVRARNARRNACQPSASSAEDGCEDP